MKRFLGILVFMQLFFCTWLNGQTGPGGIETNDGNSSLKIWLDASRYVYRDSVGVSNALNGDRIRFWKGWGATSIHASVNVSKQRPEYISSSPLFNGEASIRFRAKSDSTNELNALFTTSFPLSSDMSVYAVFHALVKGGGTNNSSSGKYNPDHWYYGAGIVDADMNYYTNDMGLTITDTSLAAGMGSPQDSLDFTIKTPLGLNKTSIASLIRTSTGKTLDVFANGGIKNTVTTTYASPFSTPNAFAIGSTLPNTSYYDNHLDGYISSVLVFTKPLSLAEQIILENYLSARYNTSLSASHDYYKMDDPANGNFDVEVAGIGQASDGSKHIDSQGDGNIRVSGPDNLSNDEFLFWGHNPVPVTEFESADVPAGFNKKFKRQWRVSEAGEVGSVSLSAYLPGITLKKISDLILIIDRNNNGIFSDEPASSFIVASSLLKTDTYVFSPLNLADGMLFTFAFRGSVFTDEKNPVITPNGDEQNDVFPIEGTGEVMIFNRDGNLVRKLTCPCSWDGTDQDGSLATTGLYIIKFADNKITTLTLIR